MVKSYCILYVATLVIMLAMDMLWLKGIAHQFYKDRLGDLLEFRPIPGIIFYLIYVAGILVFVSAAGEKWPTVLITAAFFGFLAFATYDLTNLATLRVWTVQLAAVDIAWGVFNTAFSATLGWIIMRALIKS